MSERLPQEALLFLKRERISPRKIERIKGDGSQRTFYRLFLQRGSLILILPQAGSFGLKEASSYAQIGLFLRSQGLPVPRIHAFDQEKGFLLVEDLGDLRLEDLKTEEKKEIYPEVLALLISFQGKGEAFDLSWTLETPRYHARLMWEKEACYFMESFLKNYLRLKIAPALQDEIYFLWQEAQNFLNEEVLLHRDFQSRNIMVKDGRPYLIDFQGTRLGPPGYDLASLLFDPYAQLEPSWRKELFDLYLKLSGRNTLFGYHHLALFRLFQALGAFAKLSLAGKTWFRAYIPPALRILLDLLREHFPQARHLLHLIARLTLEEA